MTSDEKLTLLKQDLQMLTTANDTYLKSLIVAAETAIQREGITLSELDAMEQYWILTYTKRGYQCRYNKTAGGQGEGKEKINEFRPQKGYRDGLKQGRKNLARELSHIIDKHLVVGLKPEKINNKVSIKAYEKFLNMLKEGDK